AVLDHKEPEVEQFGQRARNVLLMNARMGSQLSVGHGKAPVLLAGVLQVLDDQAIKHASRPEAQGGQDDAADEFKRKLEIGRRRFVAAVLFVVTTAANV